MAYLDLSDAGSPILRERPVKRLRLDRHELAVVRLALNDKPASLAAPSPLHSLLRRAFGLTRPNRLADARLEALRRLVVSIHHEQAAPRDVRRTLDAGFTQTQLDQAASLARAAPVHAGPSLSPPKVVLAFTLLMGVFWVAAETIGDLELAALVAIILTLPLASWLPSDGSRRAHAGSRR